MNIVTTCTKHWLPQQLPRFVHFARKAMPDVKLYLVYLGEQDAKGHMANDLHSQFERVLGVQTPKFTTMPDILLYSDFIRASFGTMLGLDEYLYIDTDVDILEDISDIPSLSDTDILWTRSPIPVGSVEEMIRRFDYTDTTNINIGLLYIRKDISKILNGIQRDVRYDPNMFIAGSAAWNIALRQHMEKGGTHAEIPATYNTIFWDTANLAGAKVIHYAGQRLKTIRLMAAYDDWPDAITIKVPKDATVRKADPGMD